LSAESSDLNGPQSASGNASIEKSPADDSGQQSAGEEELADVMYESSCQMEVKEYEMGKHLGRKNQLIS
jgi:hypothetical protein